MHWRRKWQPTPVFLPGESQGRGSLVGCHLGRLEGGWQISVQESCTNSLGLSVFNGESGVELEGSLAVQTLGNILLGVLVLIGTRKKVDMPGDGGQGRRGLQASPPLLLPLLGDF